MTDAATLTPPLVPADAPFTAEQRHWLNGYLTGLTTLARARTAEVASATGPSAPTAPAVPLLILYGSQSGNCEALSKDLRKLAKARGFDPAVSELDKFDIGSLPGAGAGHLVIVTSTFGEGDPPDNAKQFYDRLMSPDFPPLPATLHYSVCGLGDSTYTHFNKCARDLDARLAALGATRAVEFACCDVAFEDDYAAWKAAVFDSEAFRVAPAVAVVSSAEEPAAAPETYHKNNPFPAMVLDVRRLSAADSAKEVNHVEISLAGSGLTYEPGDALGVWPVNCAQQVDDVLAAARLTGRETVTIKGEPTTLRAALLNRLDVVTANARTLAALGVAAGDELAGLHLVDVLERRRPDCAPQTLADALRPLQPRLYSIASSPLAHPGEVHLTVGAVRYEMHGRPRKGVASTHLADRCGVGATLGVYLQRSPHFRVPAPDVPLIMVGPGTGVAPFRAFLEHRAETRAPGKSWLFFGDQHERTDFLYREQIEGWRSSGVLHHFDAAWSRDQGKKVYVQHRMLEAGEEMFDWLEEGACVYVCGDAARMAGDVDAALRQIIAEHGNRNADAYVQLLKEQHRYQRDVY